MAKTEASIERDPADRFLRLVKEITDTVNDKTKAGRLFDTAVQFVHATLNFQLAVVGSRMPLDRYRPLMDVARGVINVDEEDDEETMAMFRAAVEDEEQSHA
jgi:hypothetical protein